MVSLSSSSRALLLVLLVSSPHGVLSSWVDPDTPVDAMTTASLVDGRPYELVFSDEFEVAGRTFDDGHDPRWTALHKNDYTNTALQFYDKGKVTTNNGWMNITTTTEDTTFLAQDDKTLKYSKVKKNYKSGMVQGWNKFCFTGGIIEVRAKLPGVSHIGGLWPAIWLLGNLARATYIGSSTWMWPWSFDSCDLTLQPKQAISKCAGQPHFGLNPHQGRGAPEMDILEAMPGAQALPPSSVGRPYFSTSLQIAPGVSEVRPGAGGPPPPGTWYQGLEYGGNTSQNIFFYGTLNEHFAMGTSGKVQEKYTYQSDAVSANTQLDRDLWETFRTFRFEWQLPQTTDHGGGGGGAGGGGEGSSGGSDRLGYIRWYMDGVLVYGITGQSLNDKMKGSQIPTEPQYVLLNTAISSSWGFPSPCPANCKCDCFDCKDLSCACGIAPGFCGQVMGHAHFLVDHVRVWQAANDTQQKVGCSTPERPSKQWIIGHANWYKDDWDAAPLKPLSVGGGACRTDNDCGGVVTRHRQDDDDDDEDGGGGGEEKGLLGVGSGRSRRGVCAKSSSPLSLPSLALPPPSSTCRCETGWVGPHCRASQGFDPVDWEALKDQDHDALGLGLFALPSVPLPLAAAALLLALASCAAVGARVWRLRHGDNKTAAAATANGHDQGGLPSSSLSSATATHGPPQRGGQFGRTRNSSSSEMAPIVSRRHSGPKSYSLVPARSEVQLSDIPLNNN